MGKGSKLDLLSLSFCATKSLSKTPRIIACRHFRQVLPVRRRMKRFLVLICALIAAPLFAGVTYEFQSVTTGVRGSKLTGTVAADGARMRMDVKTGDDFLIKDNSIVLSNDGGETLTVIDPKARTYYVINLNAIAGSSTSMAESLRGMLNLSFSNPKVSVRNIGAGVPMSGYPTQRSVVDTAYDVSFDVMGSKATTHLSMTTENWTTDQLAGDLMNFMQSKNLRTGIEQIDKLIGAQSAAIKGRFPLKQVTTIRVRQGGSEMVSTATSEVSKIVKKDIAASQFVVPRGLNKVDDPITRIMKNLR